jgi:putative transposase
MKRGRFSEEQIIAILREHEAGAKAAELARKHGISEATLYNWKAKYGDLDVSEAKRLRTLEEENRKLKKLLAGCSPCAGRRINGQDSNRRWMKAQWQVRRS